MLGTSLSPSSPRITSGFPRFIQATRLFVVPRSMPTTLSWLSNSIWNIGGFIDQVGNVFAAIQQAAYLSEVIAVLRGIPPGKLRLQFGVSFSAHSFKPHTRGFQLRQGIGVPHTQLFQCHVQFENLF